jgi:hypothetical protein
MSRYLNLVSDNRPLDIQALLEAGFFAPNANPLSEAQQSNLGINNFALDDFSRETSLEGEDLTRFLERMQSEIQTDPALFQQLNDIRQQLGLPPLENPSQAGLQDPSSMLPEELAALLVMWALQQQQKQGGGGGGGQHHGNMGHQNYSNVRPANNNWGGGGSGGGSGGGGSSGGGGGVSHAGHGHGGGSSATGGGNPNATTKPGQVPPLGDVGNVTPGENGVPAGLRPNAARGAAHVREVFGFDGTIGGIGQRSGPSDHPDGNAIDVMTNQNSQLGRDIAQYFIDNAEALGVKYVIFEQTIYQASNGWQGKAMEDRGSPTANHMDHPHISFY